MMAEYKSVEMTRINAKKQCRDDTGFLNIKN